MPDIIQIVNYKPLQSVLPPEPYQFKEQPKIDILDGKKFRALHNVNSQGQYTAIHSSKFQRVHPTQEEFSGGIGESYKNLVNIQGEGVYTAKLKPNDNELTAAGEDKRKEALQDKATAEEHGSKGAAESNEKDFHLAFREEMSSPDAPANRGFFSKIWDKMTGENEKLILSKEGDNKVGIKTNTSEATGDSLEVQPIKSDDIKDKSDKRKIVYGVLLGALGVALVATGIGLPILYSAAGLVIGLGALGGVLGLGTLAKLCSNIKSPWWASTVDGQRQWAERKAAVDVGDGIEKMVCNQVLKGTRDEEAKPFNPADQSEWKSRELCKPETVVGWMKLAKQNTPDEMKAKIREELLNPSKSFLNPQTIKDAKRLPTTGWWFTGNPKGHAEKTVNIVAEEIYRGVIRGLASGYMGLVEAEMADAKTKTAQDNLGPWLATNIEGFKSALSRFPAGVDANQPADGALESRAFEFYDTDTALAKVESYQKQAAAVQTELNDKKDIIGDANHGVYSEVLKSFNHDVATFKDSLGVLNRLVHGNGSSEGDPTLRAVNSGLGKILDTHLIPSGEMESVDEIQRQLNADLAKLDSLIAKEVADDNANPVLLKQHYDGLTELSAKYKGENGAIQSVAKFANTLATAENALKGGDLTREKIQEQKNNLDGLSNLSQGDACPLKTDNEVLGKISRAETNRDNMVADIIGLGSAYDQFEQMKAATAGLVEKAKSNLGDALRSGDFKKLGEQKDSVLLGLKKWKETKHAIPVDLNPETKFASIKGQMVAGAIGLPEESDLESMGFALEALCEESRTGVVDKLKTLDATTTADLLTKLNTIHDGQSSDTVKAAKTYEAAVHSEIDSNVAATLAKTLYPRQAAQVENFRKFSVVLSNLDTVKERFAESLAIWAQLEGIQGADTSTRSGFLELLGHEKLGVSSIGQEALRELKTQVDQLGDQNPADHADKIAGIDSTTLERLEYLSNKLAGHEISEKITQAVNRLRAQIAVLDQQIGGEVGLSDAAKVVNVSELEVAGVLIKQVAENQNDAGIELKNATLSANEAANAIHELVGANISVEEISKKLLKNNELNQLLQLGIEAEKAVARVQDIPSLSHEFTQVQLEKGLLDLGKCPIVSVFGLSHLQQNEKQHLAKRNKVIQLIQKETIGIDVMESIKAQKVTAKAIQKYRTEIENFLHEERAYEAMKSIYHEGTVSTADLRKLFEKHLADYQQTRVALNTRLGIPELLSETNLKTLDDKHLQNLDSRNKTLTNLRDATNPQSIWRESAYLKGVENRLTEIRGEGKIKEAFEQAASGGLVEYGKRLHEGDAGKSASPEQLRLTYLKGQSEAVKRGLKYLNPKNMEIVRPGLFRRAYNKIFSPATKYEKLVGSADLSSFQINIAKLSQNNGLKKYLEGTLEELKEQQSILVEKRNALVGDAKKVEMGLRMFAIDQLVNLVASHVDAKLSESDFNAAVAKWREQLGDSQNAFSDLEANLKSKLVGKSISELEADLDPETQAEFDKQLESLEAHERDVARAFDQLAAKFNAADDLGKYKEMTRIDFGNSRLFVRDRDDKKLPTWMSNTSVTIQPQDKIINILEKMKNAVSNESLRSNLAALSKQFVAVEAVHELLTNGVKDESLHLEELQNTLPQIGKKVGLIKKETDLVFNAIRKMPHISGSKSASESLRERLTVGYTGEQSAVDTMQDRLNREIAIIEQLQVKLEALVEKAMNDTDAEMGSQIGDEDGASSRESKIQYITQQLGDVEGLAELLSRLSPEDLMDFQTQALNAMNPEEKSALLVAIQAKAVEPARQPATNSVQAVAEAQVPQNIPSNQQSFTNVSFDSFPRGDKPRPKLNNEDWSKATGKPPGLADYVHIPSRADGYCLITALAASRNQTTKELIAQLDVLAGNLDINLKNRWEIAKRDANSGAGIDQSEILQLLVTAGLNFRVVQLTTSGDFESLKALAPDPAPTADSPVLLFRDKHFDLLLPKSVAEKNNLPYDGSKFIKNDVFQ